MLQAVNHVIARHDIKADGWRRSVERNRFIRTAGVSCRIAHAHLYGVAVVRHSRQVTRWHVNAPDTTLQNLRGITISAKRHGHRLTNFGRCRAGNCDTRPRFTAVDHVIARNRIDSHGWRSRIHAVLTTRRGDVAVHVGDTHLHAGVAIFQSGEIGGRHGCRPVAVGINFRGVRLAAKGDGYGLVFFHVGRAARKHQFRTFFSRVDHVVGGNGIDADGYRRQVDSDVMADSHRVARRALAFYGDGYRPRSQGADICRRDCRAPGAVCQHGCCIGFAIDRYGKRGTNSKTVAGTGDDQVLTVLDAVDHIIARHGVHTQTR